MSNKLICHAVFTEFAHTSLMEFLRLSNAVDGAHQDGQNQLSTCGKWACRVKNVHESTL